MQSPRSSDLSCLHSISKVNVSHFNVLFCHDRRFLCQWAPYLVSPVKATCESKPIHHSQGGLTSCACSLTHSCICILLLCTGVGRREKGVGRGARAEKGEEREGEAFGSVFSCSGDHQSAQDTEQFLSDEDPHVVLITASTFLLSSLNSAAWCLWGLSGSSVHWEFLQPPEGLTMCSFFMEEEWKCQKSQMTRTSAETLFFHTGQGSCTPNA